MRLYNSESHHDDVSTWILSFKFGVQGLIRFSRSLGSISCTNKQ